MAYQYWVLHPVKPRKGDIKYRGMTVKYWSGDEGSEMEDADFIKGVQIRLAGENAELLGAAINGKIVLNNDKNFMSKYAHISVGQSGTFNHA